MFRTVVVASFCHFGATADDIVTLSPHVAETSQRTRGSRPCPRFLGPVKRYEAAPYVTALHSGIYQAKQMSC
jgi:hypothetical protein